ncbi:IS5 family transposase [Amycolatopsis sp. ATCC 39116]|uniref:IS5 family transposase n=1 Tax=Amycolatopsis sp. (strain ATCC 39116 / 75iv2) TaxID=385957 RepID=UPI0035105C44
MDRAWARIEPLLPVSGRGRRWRDHRQVLDAILWKLRTGAPWRDLPEQYGPWKTAHERLRLWTADGTWQKILDEAIVKDTSVGEVAWVISVDSSVVRAHQHSAGARKKGGLRPRRRGARGRRERTRTLPRRTEHHNPPRRRWPRAADAGAAHRRPRRRQPTTATARRHRSTGSNSSAT